MVSMQMCVYSAAVYRSVKPEVFSIITEQLLENVNSKIEQHVFSGLFLYWLILVLLLSFIGENIGRMQRNK